MKYCRSASGYARALVQRWKNTIGKKRLLWKITVFCNFVMKFCEMFTSNLWKVQNKKVWGITVQLSQFYTENIRQITAVYIYIYIYIYFFLVFMIDEWCQIWVYLSNMLSPFRQCNLPNLNSFVLSQHLYSAKHLVCPKVCICDVNLYMWFVILMV